MKTFLVYILACCSFIFSARAQTGNGNNYRNFPIILTIQFHSLSMPFRDLKSNFSNVGFGLGTAVSLNGKDNWSQQISAVWFRNKTIGNGLLIYTQSVWRPTISGDVFGELKAGMGYMYAFRPVKSFKQINGAWTSVGHLGKGMITLPVGMSIGINSFSTKTYLSPFASYQFLVVKGYNTSVPVLPETLIQVGSRIHPK